MSKGNSRVSAQRKCHTCYKATEDQYRAEASPKVLARSFLANSTQLRTLGVDALRLVLIWTSFVRALLRLTSLV